MKKVYTILLTFCIFSTTTYIFAGNPVNPNASKEARELLKYLYEISEKKETLTGMHNVLGRMSINTDSVYKITGKYPSIWGGDFGFADSTHDIDNIEYRSLLVEEIKKQHRRGAIIVMTYHQANPLIGEPCPFEGGIISKLNDQQWEELLTPGTGLYEKWRMQMDLLASYLKQLKELHIPVIFRPYHEMNGNWFWWGGRKGPHGFIALWKQLYTYYTEHHQLDNLLWAWNPDKPWEGVEDFFPGHETVDLFGCDIYPMKEKPEVYPQEWYDRMKKLAAGKPLALTEHSKLPTEADLKAQPWTWFMSWGDMLFNENSPEAIRKIYDRCITAERSFSGQEIQTLDLSPAKWIWYPSQRVLQNTFILFRKEINLEKLPESAKGWILADSRYQLFVNGERVQWGPAPFDPRWPEADPLDLKAYLKPGKNVIACQVLYYGFGEGTWPMGKPGFLFRLDMDGQQIVSDNSWQTYLAQSWKPGQYKRSFLRTLQEDFDARKFPYGWNTPAYIPDTNWLPALESGTPASEPSICAGFGEYQWEIFGDPSVSGIRARSIPMMNENNVKINRLVETAWIEWKRPAEEYFDVLAPNAYTSEWAPFAKEINPDTWSIPENKGKAAVLTFDFKEQSVGWPYFTIEAPAGTVIELLVHEAHQEGGPVLINSHFHSWSRFICKEGVNHFETFDFESLRWLQLHIRNYTGEVKISNVGMRRRQYPFPETPRIKLSDPSLQRLMNAAVNTLYNSAQETVVDGMARERQQYSGDGGHQLHALYQVFGESRLPARFINTFSQGISLDGYFMDSWPAFDRLARIMERQMQLTGWGPILDHGVGFCFDNWYYYQYTNDTIGLRESFPRLLTFYNYLQSIRSPEDNLLPVENLGIPSVWIDHQAYQNQKHKQCAFNLYTSAMCIHALAPLCRAFGKEEQAATITRFGQEILAACIKKYWSETEQTFVNNLPWKAEEGTSRYCDRSLATAILFQQCPNGNMQRSVEILSERPKELGISYPCNAVWPYWALISAGRADLVLHDLRTKWSNMPSVLLNNTIQEFWEIEPDSWSQWSHCAVAPLIMLYQGIAGIQPTSPGYETVQIRPQLGDLEEVSLSVQTVKGPIVFQCKGKKGNRVLYLEIPSGMKAELLLDTRETKSKYTLKGGDQLKLKLKYT